LPDSDEATFCDIYVNDPTCGTPGCMNPSACNYNPMATEEDGTCLFLDSAQACTCPTLGGCGPTGFEIIGGNTLPVWINPEMVSILDDVEHSLRVVNVRGEEVFIASDTRARQYSLSGIDSGIYFLHITIGDMRVIERIIRF
jgi:hypothetical protein